ncbi:MAG TPA: DEAD/DEAH box helicase [Gemmatimonadales bacterium]|nr:DEAD/DEAH box helicase [Gemmatimonadales bacterium]
MTVPPAEAARAVLAGLLEPLDTPASADALPRWLLPHQLDAVRRCEAILRRFGGVLLADGVGLGKTFVALALAALERRRGGDAAAIVPAALRPEWLQAMTWTGTQVPLLSHTRLARGAPVLDDRVSLLLVDEAHAFRNPATRRYEVLSDLAAGRRVALLTATPFNNSPADLTALVQLFSGRDRYREFGVADLPAALAARDRRAALALAALSVCRSRRLVQERFPALRASFPSRRLTPVAEYDLSTAYGGALEPLLSALARVAQTAPDLSRGAALLHLALLRRLESSRTALRRSLRRHREFVTQWSEATAAGRRISRRGFGAMFPRHDEDDTQLSLLPYLVGETQAASSTDLAEHLVALERALEITEGAGAGNDPKLEALETLLARDLAGRRTIVFTEYRDTAMHLAARLRRRFRVLAVTGDAAWAGRDRLSRREALDAFAPVSRRVRARPLLEANVLVATDVASEGMNLQDASAVVNYDLPWNPVRVMQRIGRVDRLGALRDDVVLAHLLPAGGLRQLTGVLRALRDKLHAGPDLLGIEPDPLAALWWIDGGPPLIPDLEAESWRRVEPFEAADRWRATVGPTAPPRPSRPLIAAGMVADRGAPAAGLLLALEWPNGSRIPLPYVVGPGGEIAADGIALGSLAARALEADPLPTAPVDFAGVLGSVLARARSQLPALSAARRGLDSPGVNRRHALDALLHAAHRAEESRDAVAAAAVGLAVEALRHELPVGLERRLGRLLREHRGDDRLPEHIARAVLPALPPPAPVLDGTPRLVLVAGIALATRCPCD